VWGLGGLRTAEGLPGGGRVSVRGGSVRRLCISNLVSPVGVACVCGTYLCGCTPSLHRTALHCTAPTPPTKQPQAR